MKFNIALIPGDGIGPECIKGATLVLDKVSKRFGHEFKFTEADAGGIAIDKYGIPLPLKTIDTAKASDSVLLGAVGGPRWDGKGNVRPEQALLGLRSELGLYANLRPSILFDALKDACPLKSEIADNGFDIMMVRELTGGIYFGESGRYNDGNTAFDTETYSAFEIERVIKRAILIAKARKKNRLTIIDKANVLESSRLWREVALRILKDEPTINYDFMYVDNAAMQLIRNPAQFDTIVTSNIFGDILSDEAAMITGSLGMLPSASLGDGGFGMYEPAHGSAPDIAGKNIANPIATILSVAMMLKYSFSLDEEAMAIDEAVLNVLKKGYRTADLGGNCKTDEISKLIGEEI